MSEPQDSALPIARLEHMATLLEMQHDQISELGSAVKLIAEQMLKLHADTKITKIVAALLVNEVARSDRGHLDRLLARAIGRAEREVEQFSPAVRAAILTSIDELLALTE